MCRHCNIIFFLCWMKWKVVSQKLNVILKKKVSDVTRMKMGRETSKKPKSYYEAILNVAFLFSLQSRSIYIRCWFENQKRCGNIKLHNKCDIKMLGLLFNLHGDLNKTIQCLFAVFHLADQKNSLIQRFRDKKLIHYILI